MFGLFKRYSISILDNTWTPIKNNVQVRHIPRQNELVYIEELKHYFKVINVVYYLNKKQGIFIVVEQVKPINNGENEKK